MRKIRPLFMFLLSLLALTAMGQQPVATTLTDDGDFDSSTHWYFLQNGRGYYISTGSGYVDSDGYLYANQTSQSLVDSALWCVVGNETDGYKFYNKAAGATKHLAVTGSEGSARFKLYTADEISALSSPSETFDFYTSTYSSDYTGIKTHGSDYNSINPRAPYLALWSSDSPSDVGNAWKFIEFTDEMTSLIKTELALYSTTKNVGTYYVENGSEFQTVYNEATTAVAEGSTTDASTLRTIYEKLREGRSTCSLVYPESGKLYRIVSAYTGFQTNQSVDKAIYSEADTGTFGWNTVDASDPNYYWIFDPVSGTTGQFQIKSLYCNTYMYGAGSLSATSATTYLTWLEAPGEFNLRVGGSSVSPLHAKNHNNGSGVSGSIIGWDGASNSPSSWSIVEISDEDVVKVQATLSASAQEVLTANADKHVATVTALGQISTERYNKLEAAKTAVTEATDNSANSITLLSNLAEAIRTIADEKIYPVYTIENKQPTYGVGKCIVADVDNAANHFTTINTANGRQLWVIQADKAEIEAGTYVIYNLYTGEGLRSSSAQNKEVTITATGDITEGQWHIKMGGNTLHAQNSGSLLVEWNNNDTGNSGSAWVFNYVGTTAEMPTTAQFTNYFTALSTVTTATSWLGYIGTGYGKYNGNSVSATTSAINEKIAAINALTLDNVKAETPVTTANTDLQTVISGLTLNIPAAGDFLRVVSANTNVSYLSGNNYSSNSNRAAFVNAADNRNTVFFYDGTHLLNVGNGYYIANTTADKPFLHYNGVTTGSNIIIQAADSNTIGQYNVRFNGGGRYLYAALGSGATEGVANAGTSTGSDVGYRFTLDAVDALEVDITAAKYTTFSAPVSVNIPEHVKAFKGVVNGDLLEMTEIENVIPANTGVILRSDEAFGDDETKTYSFTIVPNTYVAAAATADDDNDDNALVSTTATIYKSTAVSNFDNSADATIFTLQKRDGSVGLYPFGTQDTSELKGFKAYLPLSPASNVRGFVFDSQTTGIDNVSPSAPTAADTFYDLSGRRVNHATHGIYIMRGKKVIIR